MGVLFLWPERAQVVDGRMVGELSGQLTLENALVVRQASEVEIGVDLVCRWMAHENAVAIYVNRFAHVAVRKEEFRRRHSGDHVERVDDAGRPHARRGEVRCELRVSNARRSDGHEASLAVTTASGNQGGYRGAQAMAANQ